MGISNRCVGCHAEVLNNVIVSGWVAPPVLNAALGNKRLSCVRAIRAFKLNISPSVLAKGPTPFRDVDLYRLEILIRERRRIISIVGGSHSGKQRLIEEFVEQNKTEFASFIFDARTINLQNLVSDSELKELLEWVHPNPGVPLLIGVTDTEIVPTLVLRSYIPRLLNFKMVHSVILTGETSNLDIGNVTEFLLESLSESEVRAWAEKRVGVLYEFDEDVARGEDEHEDKIIQVCRPSIVRVNDEIIRRLKSYPQDVFKLHSRKFEEVILELLADQGCEVELTQATHDGGFDILARLDTPLGKVLTIVDTKRLKETRPIGVGLVRQLYGTLKDFQHSHGASHGMMVTSSRYTRESQALRQRHEYELSLKDYSDIVTWIAGYKKA